MQRDVTIYLPLLLEREDVIECLKCIDSADYKVSPVDWRGLGYCIFFADKNAEFDGYVYVIYNPPGEYGLSADEVYGDETEDREFLAAADSYHCYALNYTSPDLAKLVIGQFCRVAGECLAEGWIRNGGEQICRLSDVCQRAQEELDWNFADYGLV